MKTKLINIVKFLFPEWQIYDDFKQHGFIARRNQEVPSKALEGQQMRQQQPVTPVGNTSYHQGNQRTVSGNTVEQRGSSKKTVIKHSGSKIDQTFQNIRERLSMRIIGQQNYLDQLVLA